MPRSRASRTPASLNAVDRIDADDLRAPPRRATAACRRRRSRRPARGRGPHAGSLEKRDHLGAAVVLEQRVVVFGAEPQVGVRLDGALVNLRTGPLDAVRTCRSAQPCRGRTRFPPRRTHDDAPARVRVEHVQDDWVPRLDSYPRLGARTSKYIAHRRASCGPRSCRSPRPTKIGRMRFSSARPLASLPWTSVPGGSSRPSATTRRSSCRCAPSAHRRTGRVSQPTTSDDHAAVAAVRPAAPRASSRGTATASVAYSERRAATARQRPAAEQTFGVDFVEEERAATSGAAEHVQRSRARAGSASSAAGADCREASAAASVRSRRAPAPPAPTSAGMQEARIAARCRRRGAAARAAPTATHSTSSRSAGAPSRQRRERAQAPQHADDEREPHAA